MKTIIRNKEIADIVADSITKAGATVVAVQRVDGGYEVEVHSENGHIAQELFPLRKWER